MRVGTKPTHDHNVIKFATLMTVYHRFGEMSIEKAKNQFDSTAEALKINIYGAYPEGEKHGSKTLQEDHALQG